MSNWKLIQPAERFNRILNPQFRYNVLDGWSFTQLTGTGGGRTRTVQYQFVGPASCELDPGDGSARLQSESSDNGMGVTAGGTAYLHLRARIIGSVGNSAQMRLAFYNLNNAQEYGAETFTLSTDNDWVHYIASWYNTGISAAVVARIEAITGGWPIYIDAIQLEETGPLSAQGATEDTHSTYIDGDQPGGVWMAAPHNSDTYRSESSRAGGLPLDLKDDFNFGVRSIIDAGAPPVTNYMHEYAILPGGELTGTKTHPRGFTLSGVLKNRAATAQNLHAMRKKIVDEILPWAYPRQRGQYQPVKLVYEGAETTKFIRAHYEAPSLNGVLGIEPVFTNTELLDLHWLAEDPFWYAEEEQAIDADIRRQYTGHGIMHRSVVNGAWSQENVTSAPSGGSITVYAIAFNPVDGKYYVGGNFTGFNGQAGLDYIVRYNPETGVWEQPASNYVPNGTVRAITVAPNGDVYIGGDFTNVNGVTGADGIAYLDFSFDPHVWQNLGGSAGQTPVYALEWDADGNLWIGGNFADWSGNSAMDYLVYWDGSTYSYTGANNVNGDVRDLMYHNSKLYVVGDFTNQGNFIASYDGSTWTDEDPDNTFSFAMAKIDVDSSGILYAIEWEGGNSVYRRVGTAWEKIGGAQAIYNTALAVAPDDTVWVSGLNLTGMITGDDVTNEGMAGVAMWTGSNWVNPGIAYGTGGSSYTRAFLFEKEHPVIDNRFEVWVGTAEGDTIHTPDFGNVVLNNGSAPAKPTLVIKVTSGSFRLVYIQNEETGDTIFLNYEILENETLTLKFAYTGLQITSTRRGDVTDAIIPGGDEGEFHYAPGQQSIGILAIGSGAWDAYSLHRDTYGGVD